MIAFPNCKINLGLQILRKREDGFHDLETVFHPIPLSDGLEVVTSPAGSVPFTLSISGAAIEGALEANICYKAWALLKKDFPDLPPMQVHLHKNIPMGAGLGGGSADGSFLLKLLNEKYRLGLSNEALINYALQLGSDCPFFILNRTCFASGRGEKLEPLALDLSPYRVVIVNPGIHVNTGWAFSKIKSNIERPSLQEIIKRPVSVWKDSLVNDFEGPVGDAYPSVLDVKTDLYEAGAVYASMSGSGSTVFGLFPAETLPRLHFPETYFVSVL